MKEATGELSMTAVAVVAIVAVGGLISAFVIPNMKTSLERKTLCSGAYSCGTCNNGTMLCTVQKSDGKIENNYACPCTDTKTTTTKS